jgi:hypothetical protein
MGISDKDVFSISFRYLNQFQGTKSLGKGEPYAPLPLLVVFVQKLWFF